MKKFQNKKYPITKSRTQRGDVLNDLKTGLPLTSINAISQFGCTRLSGVIHYWRGRGHNIKTELIEVRTRYGHSTVARYSMTQVSYLDGPEL